MRIHDPHHVAHLAAVLLSSRGEPEAHHIKTAVTSAMTILDEAHRQAEEAEMKAAEEPAAAAEKADGQDAAGQQ